MGRATGWRFARERAGLGVPFDVTEGDGAQVLTWQR